MNNLEKLLAGDTAALSKIIGESEGIICSSCPAADYCQSEAGAEIDGCAETRATWLLQAIQLDSWDQIEADAKKSYTDYFGCSVICNNCPAVFSDGRQPHLHYDVSNCHKAMVCDLVDRCKQLALDMTLPPGGHNAYTAGDRITYNGEAYVIKEAVTLERVVQDVR